MHTNDSGSGYLVIWLFGYFWGNTFRLRLWRWHRQNPQIRCAVIIVPDFVVMVCIRTITATKQITRRNNNITNRTRLRRRVVIKVKQISSSFLYTFRLIFGSFLLCYLFAVSLARARNGCEFVAFLSFANKGSTRIERETGLWTANRFVAGIKICLCVHIGFKTEIITRNYKHMETSTWWRTEFDKHISRIFLFATFQHVYDTTYSKTNKREEKRTRRK